MDGNTFILKMASGPEMILTVKMDVMRTSVEDRKFIFKSWISCASSAASLMKLPAAQRLPGRSPRLRRFRHEEGLSPRRHDLDRGAAGAR